MTRRDKLIAMNGAMLIEVADKLGVKVNCNKTRTSLKEAKAKVVDRIIAKEEELATESDADEEVVAGGVETTENDGTVDDIAEVETETVELEEVANKKPVKKSAKISDLSNDVRMEIRDNLIEELNQIDGVEAYISVKYPLWIHTKVCGKSIFGIGLSKKSLRVRTIKEVLADGVEFAEVKGGFSATVHVDYSEIREIVKMVRYAIDNFKDSDILSKKRKKKEVA